MYGADAGLIAYHLARPGRSHMSDLSQAERDQLRQLASSTLDSLFEARFVGLRTSIGQLNAWPRRGPEVTRLGLSDQETPIVVEWSAYELAYLVHANPDFFGAVFSPGTMIKRETVGPLTTEYAVPADTSSFQPRVPLVEGMLSAVLKIEGLRGIPTFLVV